MRCPSPTITSGKTASGRIVPATPRTMRHSAAGEGSGGHGLRRGAADHDAAFRRAGAKVSGRLAAGHAALTIQTEPAGTRIPETNAQHSPVLW